MASQSGCFVRFCLIHVQLACFLLCLAILNMSAVSKGSYGHFNSRADLVTPSGPGTTELFNRLVTG